jgi:hypothetical protein
VPSEPVTPPAEPTLLEQYDIGEDVAPAPPAPIEAETPPAETPPAPKTPPKDPATGKFVKRPHPDRLLRTAAQIGISTEEIEEASTAELREMVRDATLEKLAQQRSKDIEAAKRPPSTPAPEPAAPVDLGIDESQYDPGLISLIKKQAEEIRQMRAQMGHMGGHIKRQAEESIATRFDAAFDGMNLEKDLGRGRPPEDSPEMARRQAIVAEAIRLAGNQDPNKVIGLLGDAANKLFKLKPAKAAPKPANGATRISPEEWAASGMARPTHREGAPELPGKTKAVQKVTEYLRDNAATQETGDDLDGLL